VKHLDAHEPGTTLIEPGRLWSGVVSVTDDYDRASSDTLTVVVTDADDVVVAGATTSQVRSWLGRYRINVAGLADPGLYTVTVTGTDDAVQFVVEVLGAAAAVPDLDDITNYLGEAVVEQHPAGRVQQALAVAIADQRDKCTLPVRYTAPLAEAVRRRVARMLALDAMPLASAQDGEGSVTRYGADDPYVRKVESRYPRMVVG
jgi:hypothetical protein